MYIYIIIIVVNDEKNFDLNQNEDIRKLNNDITELDKIIDKVEKAYLVKYLKLHSLMYSHSKVKDEIQDVFDKCHLSFKEKVVELEPKEQ